MSNHDETQKLLLEKSGHASNTPFSESLLKDFVARHVVRKETQVSKEALNLLNQVFDEIGGWIIREAEKMAASGGKTRITADHVRGAVKLYLGWEEK